VGSLEAAEEVPSDGAYPYQIEGFIDCYPLFEEGTVYMLQILNIYSRIGALLVGLEVFYKIC